MQAHLFVVVATFVAVTLAISSPNGYVNDEHQNPDDVVLVTTTIKDNHYSTTIVQVTVTGEPPAATDEPHYTTAVYTSYPVYPTDVAYPTNPAYSNNSTNTAVHNSYANKTTKTPSQSLPQPPASSASSVKISSCLALVIATAFALIL
jgi:hypothetical protein